MLSSLWQQGMPPPPTPPFAPSAISDNADAEEGASDNRCQIFHLLNDDLSQFTFTLQPSLT